MHKKHLVTWASLFTSLDIVYIGLTVVQEPETKEI